MKLIDCNYHHVIFILIFEILKKAHTIHTSETEIRDYLKWQNAE